MEVEAAVRELKQQGKYLSYLGSCCFGCRYCSIYWRMLTQVICSLLQDTVAARQVFERHGASFPIFL